jgi:hypothetical protein
MRTTFRSFIVTAFNTHVLDQIRGVSRTPSQVLAHTPPGHHLAPLAFGGALFDLPSQPLSSCAENTKGLLMPGSFGRGLHRKFLVSHHRDLHYRPTLFLTFLVAPVITAAVILLKPVRCLQSHSIWGCKSINQVVQLKYLTYAYGSLLRR